MPKAPLSPHILPAVTRSVGRLVDIECADRLHIAMPGWPATCDARDCQRVAVPVALEHALVRPTPGP